MMIMNNVAKSLLEFIGSSRWEFKPNLMKDIVEQNGGFSSLAWFAWNYPTYEKILKDWGPIRTNLLTAEISLLNGCPYCIYGHIYALQLHYLQDTNTILSVSEDEFVSWHSLTDEEAKIKKLRTFINDNDALLELGEMDILNRMIDLKAGDQQNGSKEDYYIHHLLQMFAYLNQCGITGQTTSDQAHDPINQDDVLKERYAKLQHAAAGSASGGTVPKE